MFLSNRKDTISCACFYTSLLESVGIFVEPVVRRLCYSLSLLQRNVNHVITVTPASLPNWWLKTLSDLANSLISVILGAWMLDAWLVYHCWRWFFRPDLVEHGHVCRRKGIRMATWWTGEVLVNAIKDFNQNLVWFGHVQYGNSAQRPDVTWYKGSFGKRRISGEIQSIWPAEFCT